MRARPKRKLAEFLNGTAKNDKSKPSAKPAGVAKGAGKSGGKSSGTAVARRSGSGSKSRAA